MGCEVINGISEGKPQYSSIPEDLLRELQGNQSNKPEFKGNVQNYQMPCILNLKKETLKSEILNASSQNMCPSHLSQKMKGEKIEVVGEGIAKSQPGIKFSQKVKGQKDVSDNKDIVEEVIYLECAIFEDGIKLSIEQQCDTKSSISTPSAKAFTKGI